MKIISAIKSHKIITALIAAIVLVGAGGAVYATNQIQPEKKEVVQTQSTTTVTQPEPVEEAKTVEKTEETVIKQEDTAQTAKSQESSEASPEPIYSDSIPQLVLNKAAEMQNTRKSMNERYMSDILWIYEEHPELLQEDTYSSTLAKMKAVYTSEKEPKSAMFFTLRLKEIF